MELFGLRSSRIFLQLIQDLAEVFPCPAVLLCMFPLLQFRSVNTFGFVTVTVSERFLYSTNTTADGDSMSYLILVLPHFWNLFCSGDPCTALATSAKLSGASAGNVLHTIRKERLNPFSGVEPCCGKAIANLSTLCFAFRLPRVCSSCTIAWVTHVQWHDSPTYKQAHTHTHTRLSVYKYKRILHSYY